MLGFVIILALMIPLIAVILDSQLGRALAARLERDSSRLDSGISDRVTALEGEVERLVQEVRKLEEESQFMQKLLEGRSEAGGALPPGESRG